MSDASVELSTLASQRKRELLGRLLKQRAQAAGTTGVPSLPTIAPGDAFEPFPLRDIQQAYWIGRSQDFELGNIGAHAYVEFDSPKLDLPRLDTALNTLIRRHEMMRAIILPGGQQKILEAVPHYDVAVLDLAGQPQATVDSELELLRHRLSHRVYAADSWPLFDLRVTVLPDRRTRIHFGIDLLIADLRSIYILLAEWFQLYVDPGVVLPPLGISFRDYVLRERSQEKTDAFARAQSYWNGKIPGLPSAPELPLATNPTTIASPRFTRLTTRLAPERWRQLKERAEAHQVTPASVLLAAFARTLASWSRSSRFTVNVTIFNRLPFHPDVNHLVGDFTSVTLIGIDQQDPEPFFTRCGRINEQLWEALDHRQFSGIRVLRELLRKTGSLGRAIMPVVFTCDLRHDMVSIKDSGRAALPGEVVYGVSQTPQVYLDHQVFEESGGLTINWDAVEAVFPRGMLQEMLSANMTLLEELSRDEKSWTQTAALVPESHRQLASAANATDAPVSGALLHELFARQVSLDPHKPAVISADCTLTYGELFERAECIARRLRQLGVRPNSLVGVVMEKGWVQVVAVVAILQAGGAYLPVDSDLPRERVAHLLKHGQVQLVLTQTRVDARIEWPEGIDRIRVDHEPSMSSESAPFASVQTSEDLAYVIYTSGSTGMPKGVMIDHRGAVNTILDVNDRFAVGPDDRVLALSSLSFDLSVYDIFGALAAGASIVVPPVSALRDPAEWVGWIRRERVTIWNSVPAMMEMLVDYAAERAESAINTLRLVLISGDWVPVTLPNRVKRLIDRVEVVSLGGATEASIWSILFPIEHAAPDWDSIPYGKPMRNQRFHVFDDRFDQRPVGVPGELYIGGVGLAKGYWRDEEKTAARFVAHPRTGERLYRTGDWGAYLPDGNIKFLGREDFQVKIQGYRVELGEIEAALREHPAVHSAIVTAIGDARGPKRLVAYVVSDSEPGPTDKDLKAFARGKLPHYMVPANIMRLAALPLTTSGKVDRSALPAAAASTVDRPESTATPVTTRVTRLIASALHVDRVDGNANLMELGANSLDILRIGQLLEKEFGFRPTMEDFFRFQNVTELVNYYEQQVAGSARSAGQVQPDSGRDARSLWRSFSVLIDPLARAAFKNSHPGLRNADRHRLLELPGIDADRVSEARATSERRTHRTFGQRSISLDRFGAFLGHLREISPGQTKRQYASAGGLYPVQIYLHVKEGRIDGVSEGTYYYDPRAHRLACLSDGAVLDRSIHWSANRPIFDEAAFSIFLIAQLSAIAPLYQERSVHLATLEAGLISQLLEMSAPAAHIGLCQIGDLDFDRVRRLFALDESHVLVHSLLGGTVDPDADPLGEAAEDPTVMRAAVLPAVSGGAMVAVNVSMLNAEAVLDPEIRADAPVAISTAPSRIFLTGATGFLGAFLLVELLKENDAEIHCLVRAPTAAAGALRLRRTLEQYSLWDERISSRIIPVLGDLAEPRLGLDAGAFANLAGEVDAIFHSGAHVNLIRPYAELKASNVGGTHEVLRLASRGKLKAVHFVSSVAVFPFDAGQVRRETDALDHGEELLGGYAQSKWVAEKLVAIAGSRGIPVSVYRPGTITGHSQTGAVSTDSYLSSLIRGCVELGSAPDIDAPVDMVPVDFVAKAIVRLSLRPESLHKVFHLTNPHPFPLIGLFEFMRAFGYPVRRIPYESWKQELLAVGERFEISALYPFAAFITHFKEGPTTGQRYDCGGTLDGLAGTSITCPVVDEELLNIYFSHFVNTGFLEGTGR